MPKSKPKFVIYETVFKNENNTKPISTMAVGNYQTKKAAVEKEIALCEGAGFMACPGGPVKTISGKRGFPVYFTVEVKTGKIAAHDGELGDEKLESRLRKIAKEISKK